jgi:HK97 family phage prohead protease
MFHKTVKLRTETKGNTLYGHAAVYDTETFIPGEGYEIIGRSAFDNVAKDENTDVRALFNHDPSMLLGRQSSGTLKWSTDSEGLPFEVDLPDTQLGDLDGCSFAWVEGDYDTQARAAGGKVNVHTRIDRLVDVSVVTFPAYPGTSAKLRAESPNRSTGLLRAKLTLWKGQA